MLTPKVPPLVTAFLLLLFFLLLILRSDSHGGPKIQPPIIPHKVSLLTSCSNEARLVTMIKNIKIQYKILLIHNTDTNTVRENYIKNTICTTYIIIILPVHTSVHNFTTDISVESHTCYSRQCIKITPVHIHT